VGDEDLSVRRITPDSIRPPFARYAHAVEVPAQARLIFVSGQLGVGPDDWAPEGAEEQTRLCLANIAAVLAEAGMTLADLVRLNAYVCGREHLAGYMRARDAVLAEALGEGEPPASTLMIVGGFARPEFVVEIEAVAASAAR
jgi:enamine deaminase RidA (YjgF/YER057c/UK114 family)